MAQDIEGNSEADFMFGVYSSLEIREGVYNVIEKQRRKSNHQFQVQSRPPGPATFTYQRWPLREKNQSKVRKTRDNARTAAFQAAMASPAAASHGPLSTPSKFRDLNQEHSQCRELQRG